jgi:NAD(P)-dependent dehydrogenase (short-subunit alcohol dehydrogenase family)
MGGRIEGKVAVITGGGSGIGQATVMRFLEEGAKVVFGDLNDDNSAETMALAESAGFAGSLRYRKTDVCEEDQMRDLVQAAVDEFGQLDSIYNNAGIGGAFGPVEEVSVADWDRTFNVLVRGVFLGMKYAIPALRAGGRGGSINSTASIAGINGGAGPTAYSAAKAAVVNLTRATAMEVVQHHIRVNAVAPGLIMTPLLHRGDRDNVSPEMAQKQPWPEPGEPVDIANAVLFLTSDEARFITGEILVVDGGITAKGPDLWGTGANSVYNRFTGFNEGSTGKASHHERISRD